MAELGTETGTWPSPFDSDNFSNASKARLEHEKLVAETAKALAETRKIEREVRLGRWAFLIEPAKNIIPALSILVSVILGFRSLNEQLAKDNADRIKERNAIIAARLADYQKTMTSSPTTAEFANRIAVLTLRSLGDDAIPVLIANIQLSPKSELSKTIKGVILEMNEETEFQPTVSKSLLQEIKYITVRDLNNHTVSLGALHELASLFVDIHRSNRRTNPELAKSEVTRLALAIAELELQIQTLSSEDMVRTAIHHELEQLKVDCA